MTNKSPHHPFGCSYYLRSQAVFPNIRASFVDADRSRVSRKQLADYKRVKAKAHAKRQVE